MMMIGRVRGVIVLNIAQTGVQLLLPNISSLMKSQTGGMSLALIYNFIHQSQLTPISNEFVDI